MDLLWLQEAHLTLLQYFNAFSDFSCRINSTYISDLTSFVCNNTFIVIRHVIESNQVCKYVLHHNRKPLEFVFTYAYAFDLLKLFKLLSNLKFMPKNFSSKTISSSQHSGYQIIYLDLDP